MSDRIFKYFKDLLSRLEKTKTNKKIRIGICTWQFDFTQGCCTRGPRSWFDLFAKTERQIKKAILFTTFRVAIVCQNHEASVMTDFVCCAGVTRGREGGGGVRCALSDDRCGGSAETRPRDAALRAEDGRRRRRRPAVDRARRARSDSACVSFLFVFSKRRVDSILTFMNEGRAEG